MNVNNHMRTKTFTCDDNYYLLDAADRSQAQDVNISTRSSARPLPNCTWTTLKVCTRFSRTQLCGRRTQHVSTRAIYEINVELFIPTPIPISPPSLCLSFPLRLQHLSHLIFPTQQRFSFITLMNPLQCPYPTIPHPFLHPLFSWQLSPHSPLSMPTLALTHSVTFAHDREL